MRGPNIDSDHFHLKIIVNQNPPKIYLKKNRAQIRTWDKSSLKNPFKLQEYRRSLHTKLMRQTQHQDAEKEWEEIKKAITEAAKEVIHTQSKKQTNDW